MFYVVFTVSFLIGLYLVAIGSDVAGVLVFVAGMIIAGVVFA